MGYLAAGFIAIWLLTTVYIVFMTLRQRRMEQELAGLEDALQERQSRAAAATTKPAAKTGAATQAANAK